MTIVTRIDAIDPWALGALPLGVALDLALGDPRSWPRPAHAIGMLIARTERALRTILGTPGGGRAGELLAGLVLVVVAVGSTATLVWLLDGLLGSLGGPAVLIGRGILIYWALGVRSLGDDIQRASAAPDLATARVELARMVGRDTSQLTGPEIRRACVEAVGRNTTDAVVAPVVLARPGRAGRPLDVQGAPHPRRRGRPLQRPLPPTSAGPPAGSTSWPASSPARLTWPLIALAAGLVGERGRAAFRIGRRDGRKPASPGAAAMAGALGVRLGGLTPHDGVPIRGPSLGDDLGPIEASTVDRAVLIMQITALLAATLAWSIQILVELR